MDTIKTPQKRSSLLTVVPQWPRFALILMLLGGVSLAAVSAVIVSGVDANGTTFYGEVGEFTDEGVLQACNVSCEKIVLQKKSCHGEAGCVGEITRTARQSCQPGEGMCPYNSRTAGLITSNRLILDGTPEHSAAVSLENLCPQLQSLTSRTAEQQDLLGRCLDLLNESEDTTQFNGVLNLTGEEVESHFDNVNGMSSVQLGNVTSRVMTLRSALTSSPTIATVGQGLRGQGLRHPSPGLASRAGSRESGGAAGDNQGGSSRWGMFISGLHGDGEKTDRRGTTNFGFSRNIITLGVDYLVNQHMIIGGALGYGRADTKFVSRSDRFTDQNLVLSLYGARTMRNDWVLDGSFSVGQSNYVNQRYIDYTASGTPVSTIAQSEPGGNQTLLNLGVGKVFNQFFDVDFSARLNYIKAKIDRHQETVDYRNPGLALEFDKQKIESLTSDISVSLSKAVSRGFGVLLPRASLSWNHDFNVSDKGVRARFVSDPFSTNFVQMGLEGNNLRTIFEIPKDKSDSDFAQLTLGMNVLLPKSLTLSADYTTVLGSHLIDYGYWSLNLRKDF